MACPATGRPRAPSFSGEFRPNQGAVFGENLGDMIQGFFANDFAQAKLLIATPGSAYGALAKKRKLARL